MIKEIIAVFVGGGIGSLLRYLINKIQWLSSYDYHLSTLISNTLGCFILGLALGYFLKNNNPNSITFIFLTVGFCGGFTTFSAFSMENLIFIQNGEFFKFFSYLFISLLLGILSVYTGLTLYKSLLIKFL